MKHRILPWAIAAAVAASLAACGSSHDDAPAAPPAATTDVPQSAQDSVAGLVAYIKQLIDSSSDTSEPVLVGTAVLPVDNTGEPSN
ncbi:hypothetical protein [Ramlibacter sp.]|uniref:hypothetical protein n=1 Tax=Ramlibacter sp. TaxID=1917967 RepID=UPI0017E63AAE|nr:hypothetical protein [Ramlibacter sp.]MBA2674748.1 hypothetical protein [Ramlibacter sp.]